jgi:signal transduction histidine kinase
MKTRELTDAALLSQLAATQEAVSTAGPDLDAAMQEVVDRARTLTGADAAAVERVDGDELVYRAAAGTAAGRVGQRSPAASSLSGLCAGTGELVRSEDGSALVVPLRHGGGVPCVLKVCSAGPGAFGERDEQVLRMLAASLAAAIARAELLAGGRRANKQLRRAERLQDEFLALVTHELREPLTSMAGFVDALLRGAAGELSEQQRQFLEMAARNGERLGALVNDLLLAAQLAAGTLELELEDVELRALAEQAVRSATPHAERAGVRVELEAADDVHVRGDRVRLAQVLDNLISNALKLTREGGRVRVDVVANGDGAETVVSDTGVGMPEEELARLFERFHRPSTAIGDQLPGTGLGLSIAKTLVELHGGTIEPVSTEGEGSTFRLRLPRSS